MEENLSTEQLEQLKANDILNEWLGESRFTARIIGDIDDALSVLAAKRTTLEEKIISQELHNLCAHYCTLLASVHLQLAGGQEPALEALEGWRTLNFHVHETIAFLLKALRYNLNFVEQYFEFNFCARLTNEWKFAQEAQRLSELVKA